MTSQLNIQINDSGTIKAFFGWDQTLQHLVKVSERLWAGLIDFF